MTCVVALKHSDGKVYFGADKLLQNGTQNGVIIPPSLCQKIFLINGTMVGFAGHRGLTDYLIQMPKLFSPLVDTNDDDIRKIFNVFLLLTNSPQIDAQMIISGGSEIIRMSKTGWYKSTRNIEAIGLGADVAFGAIWMSLKQKNISPKTIITNSLEAAHWVSPDSVGSAPYDFLP